MNAVQREWRLTREGFDKFLLTLDPDREKSGRIYERLQTKLISFFDWRNCPYPEDHADEVLDRVIKKIDAGEEIRDPLTYVFGIARMMLLEIARATDKERLTLSQMPPPQTFDSESEETERRIECLKVVPRIIS